MLDTITAASAPKHGRVRSLVDRDEYGPLSDNAAGLFTVPVAPVALVGARDELGHPLIAWVPDGRPALNSRGHVRVARAPLALAVRHGGRRRTDSAHPLLVPAGLRSRPVK